MPALIVLQKHGLDPKSTMLSRYGHADDSDVQQWERRVRGMAEETTKTTMPTNPECPNCFAANAIGDELCAKCGTTLDRAKYQEQRLHEAQTKAAQETRLASLEKEAAETRALLREMGEKQMLQKYGERKIKKKK